MVANCPRCTSTNVVKNGFTHYGRQNHRCKVCGRQFVDRNDHWIDSKRKDYILRALLERSSLRSICRIFNVSLTWLMTFAQQQWMKTPDNLGLDERLTSQIKELQVFGLQADEMWSFVQKKKRKRWIWVIYDPVHRLVISYHIGDRSERSARVAFDKLPDCLKDSWFETDHWQAFKKIIPENRHLYGKAYTYYIESFFATVRARVSRLVRKALSFSKSDKWHQLAIGNWQFLLET